VNKIPPWLTEELNHCPKAGDGVHRWLFRMARQLHWHMGPEAILTLLRAKINGCGREVGDAEIINAINDSARVQWRPGDGVGGAYSSRPQEAKWPAPNYFKVQELVHKGPRLADLVDRSPVRFDDDGAHTEEIIDMIFPGDPLLCAGKTKSLFATRSRHVWRGRLAEMALIVPNPMLAIRAKTKSGKVSEHTLEATGRQVYQVIEFDFSLKNRDGSADSIWEPLVRAWERQGVSINDACAALHMHLAALMPLVLVIYSGGKSLHGWYRVWGLTLKERAKFMRYAVSLGADPATWTRSQFVRMPDGLREENGKRQVTYFFNPQEAIKNGAH
jgi:hypothetical protein